MVELYDDYVITTDAYNYILQKRQIVQNGKTAGEERYKAVGYYNTFGGCLRRFHEELLKDRLGREEMMTLAQALDACHEVNKRFGDWLEGNTMLLSA